MPRGASLSETDRNNEPKAGFGTRAVHPRRPKEQPGTPVAPLLDLSTTYGFDSTDEFAHASRVKTGEGYVYTRWANPTIDAFESAVADLEGAEDAEAFATGMAAISGVLLGLCKSGERVASSRYLYGGTHALASTVLPRYGIETSLVDIDDESEVKAAAADARVLYCETISNPRMQVPDIPRLADIAHDVGALLVVDNTFASPLLCRPLELGADVVLHSATKFLGGHHDLMGGIACGSSENLEPVKDLARELGPTISPFNAWLALRGIASLHLRVLRSSESSLAVARALSGRDDIDDVAYPALESSPSKQRCDELLGGHGGGVLGFEVAGGRKRAADFQEKLRLIEPAASLGGTHSLIVHAASITHTQLSSEQLKAAGISDGWCRLSVGLEDPEDIVADLFEALDATR